MMSNNRRLRWLAVLIALAVVLAVAGSALGGVPRGVTALDEPTIPPPTPTETMVPLLTHCRLWVTSAAAELGDIVTVELWEGWGNGFEAHLSYDPTMLTLVDASWNPASRAEIPARYRYVESNTVDGTAGLIRMRAGICCYPYPNPNTVPASPSVAAVLRFRTLETGNASVQISRGAVLNFPAGCSYDNCVKSPGVITIYSPTSTPTPTPLSRTFQGTARGASGAPVPGAHLTLYRNAGSWITQASGTTGSDGVFRLFSNPIAAEFKLVLAPPLGYAASSAQLPAGLSGSVLAPDALAFTMGSETGQVGPFGFVLTGQATPQPTLPPVVLQGTVWLDANGDGMRQPEEGLAGVEITATSGGLTTVYTTITDDQGYYSLAVAPGVYTLALHDPLGRLPDQQRVVDTEAVDPGPIDWGNHVRWLPLLSKSKL